MTLTVGEISYTNTLPFFYYLSRDWLKENGCLFVPQIPAHLNREMASGRIHVGPISSFAYAQQQHKYVLFPELSVSAHGKVGSIFLFSNVPIAELTGKKIALTSTSATSVHLIKLLLAAFYKIDVTYTVAAPNYEEMMKEHDACLLIGDEAIASSWSVDDRIYRYDLGELWEEWTGLPMTYAVFAVRKDAIDEHAELLAELYQQFIDSKRKSMEDAYRPMIAAIQKRLGGTVPFWEHYFTHLTYSFGEKEQEGLLLYYRLAYEHGFLKEPVESIQIWSDVSNHHSSFM
ncbi:menaquinone biosynthetic enzyme MqnA/MqnD family protein [Halalkalibacterium ligniniphilum]|uniref:menaquinone biosynthetic enzyme MqnA/MqnD family protein n=1 Tax=Halalkalibacterium ligniniphilum TaxID=1134413 RepID=UPI00034B5EE3|nr:menaquinone biosynthesis protein [Halalkalibacterium ligniniphilum]